MKTSFLLCIFLPLTALAQNSTNPDLPQGEATRIVAFFLGDENMHRYVTLDAKKSKHVAPGSFLFQYNFRHPKFSGETFVISFTLDSAGQFVHDKTTHGIIRIPSLNDSSWITAREALRICRDQARRIKKGSLRLAWDSTVVSYDIFKKTHDFRDINPGNLVWRVDGDVLFRAERYSGTFEVNVFTGIVTRRFAIPWD